MALQNCGVFAWPPIPGYVSGHIGLSNTILDAANEAWGGVFAAPKSGTISKVLWRTGTVTTGSTMVIRLETVSASTGLPTGTLWGEGTEATQVVADTDDNINFATALGTGAVVAAGDVLAAFVSQPGSSYGSLSVQHLYDEQNMSFPYSVTRISDAWARSATGLGIAGALEYSDGSYAHIPGWWPVGACSNISFNSGSAADEIGNKFRLPFKARCCGVLNMADMDAAGDLVLYDASDTVLASVSVGAVYRASASANRAYQMFSSPVTLDANTWYRLVLKPTSASNVSVGYMTGFSEAAMAALPDGTNCIKTARADAGAWTDTATIRCQLGVLIDQLDDGAGGSGGSHPIINGGHIIRGGRV